MKRRSLLDRFEVGHLTSSKQGRDKDYIYVVLSKDKYFCYVADGKRWTVEKPKKKNVKHLQLIHVNIQMEYPSLDDETIIQAIKDFENRKAN